MRPVRAVMVLMGLAGPAWGQQAVDCSLLEQSAPRPGMMQATGYRVGYGPEGAQRIWLTLPNGNTSETVLAPVRQGIAMRMATFPQQGNFIAVFNLATVEAPHVLRVETWLRFTERPQEPPQHNWYRIRCEGLGVARQGGKFD